MEDRETIKINLDIANQSMIYGSVSSILNKNSDDYLTEFFCIIPYQINEIIMGDYKVEHQGKQIIVSLRSIENSDQDQIWQLGKDWNCGVSGSGVPSIPFSAFTDNRGNYPCVLSRIIFPYRLATWIDTNSRSGFKSDFDYEEFQVTGLPYIKEKVTSLLILNKLFKSEALKVRLKPIS
jgi:hypothetical protein